MEAISDRKTLQDIAAARAFHPIQVSQYQKQLLESSSELFTCGKKSQSKDETQAKEPGLFQQIGKLQMELEWLKNLSCSDAHERRKLINQGHGQVTISRQHEKY